MHPLTRRIFGLETEYGIMCHDGENAVLEPAVLSREMFIAAIGASSTGHNQFLVNGARYYSDLGGHPEYATAETDSVRDAVVRDKAGERFLESIAAKVTAQRRANGEPGQVWVFKNNTDMAGFSNGSAADSTHGCHENYLTWRTQGPLEPLAAQLVPFLATRQLLSGAGKILVTPRGPVYCFSQRGAHIRNDVSHATTQDRPIVNTRDEPLGDASKYRRLHIIIGDANMAEPTTLLKLGSMHLFLQMLEAGVDLPQYRMLRPAQDVARISADLSGRVPVELGNGPHTNALEMQLAYLARAREFVGPQGSTTDLYVLDLWERTLDAVATQNYSSINREIDWAIKLTKLIRPYQAKTGKALDDPRIGQLDLTYHDVSRDRGLYYRMEERGLVDRVCTEEEVQLAMVEPPGTRAAARSEFIRLAREHGTPFEVNWAYASVMNRHTGRKHSLNLSDPFAGGLEPVRTLLERAREAGPAAAAVT